MTKNPPVKYHVAARYPIDPRFKDLALKVRDRMTPPLLAVPLAEPAPKVKPYRESAWVIWLTYIDDGGLEPIPAPVTSDKVAELVGLALEVAQGMTVDLYVSPAPRGTYPFSMGTAFKSQSKAIKDLIEAVTHERQ